MCGFVALGAAHVVTSRAGRIWRRCPSSGPTTALSRSSEWLRGRARTTRAARPAVTEASKRTRAARLMVDEPVAAGRAATLGA